MQIDIQKEFRKALSWCLNFMEEGRKGEQSDWHVYHYFSASDIEKRIRAQLLEAHEHKPEGEYGISVYRTGIRITGLGGMSLLNHVRILLAGCVSRGELRADNPSGVRSCTGLRFRLPTQDLTDAEKRTQAVPREEKHRLIRHYQEGRLEHDYLTKKLPLCQQNRKQRFTFQPKFIHITGDRSKVTCKMCMKMMGTYVP